MAQDEYGSGYVPRDSTMVIEQESPESSFTTNAVSHILDQSRGLDLIRIGGNGRIEVGISSRRAR